MGLKDLLEPAANAFRNTRRRFGSQANAIARSVFYYASEIESQICRPQSRNILRRTLLQLSGATIGHHIFFGSGLRLYDGTKLTIGDKCCFGENTGIYCHDNVTIGNRFLAAPGLTINNGAHDTTTLEPRAAPITIGDDVWCGVNVTILSGVRIGNRAVIGANSLVLADIPDDAIAIGAPARVHRIQSSHRPKLWCAYDEF